MSFQVLARKWRPHKFSEVVGQEHVVTALVHALQHDRLHHAYLFTGTRGVGKTTLARILAKALNCENPKNSDPCGECSSCADIDAGRFIDLIEVDAASRTKVEDTRDLLNNVQYASGGGRYKIYLIDEVHMLSGHSFNALLKTLEEPPAHVKFLLATTNPKKIPITVLSRCMQFNLKHLHPEQIQPHLQFILQQEQIKFELPALESLAKSADGSLRDALSLLDQAIVYGNGLVAAQTVQDMLGTIAAEPVAEILQALAQQNAQSILEKIANIAELSSDFMAVAEKLLQILHRIALAQFIPTNEQNITELAQTLSKEDVQLYYQIALIGVRDLALAPDLRSGFEMLMLRMLAFKPVTPKLTQSEDKLQLTPNPAAIKPLEQNKTEKYVSNSVDYDHGWPLMLDAMKISGMTRQLANNCVIESISDLACVLLLSPKYKHLCGDTTEQKLLKALQVYLDKPIKLVIKIQDLTQETTATRIDRATRNHQTEAEQAIDKDENIQALKERLNAKVIPGTIEPA